MRTSIFHRAAALLGLLALLAGALARPAQAQAAGYALRFYGHGTADIDRVKIALDPARPVDVGGDFTLEAWLKAEPGANPSAAGQCGSNDGWIYGHIIFDRDEWGDGDYGDFGVSLSGGRLVFGVSRGAAGTTVCSTNAIADGAWHHVAFTRRAADGQLSIFIDGRLEAQAAGPAGDVSYRDGRATSYADDPFLVIGAEKHDAGASYPSFNGWVDEVRVSTTVRYTAAFTRPAAPFTPDASTAALYHFDEGPAGACTGQVLDSSGAAGGPSHGQCRYGGTGTAGPVYVADTPLAASPTAAATATATATRSATPAAPTATSAAPATATRTATLPPSTATLPPTDPPSATPAGPTDVIFADSFEAGNLLAWTTSVTDAGDLSVAGPAALAGGLGVQAVVDDNVSVYVQDDAPAAETRWRARFYLDPNSVSMAANDAFYALYGYSGSSTVVLRLEVGHSASQYRLRASARDDANAWTSSAWLTIADTGQAVELDWRAASAAGANNGGLTVWINGAQQAELTGLDNDTRRLDRVRLGIVAGVDTRTRGVCYFDAYETRRLTYIGLAAPAGTATAPATATRTLTPAPTATLAPTVTPVVLTNTPVPATATATAPAPAATATRTATPAATATSAPAAGNWAPVFDGVNDLVRAQAAVPGVGPLTVEAWVQPAGDNATGLLVVGADANQGWSLELDGGSPVFYIATAGGWQSGRHTARLSAGQWYHLAATYAAGEIRLYVDGRGVRVTGLGTLTQGPALSLGGLDGYPYFAGALDEVRLSRVIRYPADFTRPAAPFTPDADTLALWHFDEGSGQTASDASAAGNLLTLGRQAQADSADPGWAAGFR
ncbi:MAG: LamG domain-containing protein [Anaerolineales bacterium]|nr:LamG domain-containing protein [Anaerolineales bacterium]